MSAAETLAQEVGTAPACVALGVNRATLYRHRNPPEKSAANVRLKPQRSQRTIEITRF
jgi:putative transposase